MKHLEVVRERRGRNFMLALNLAAEELTVAVCDLGVDGQPIGVTQRLANQSYFGLSDVGHLLSDSHPRKPMF